MNNKIVDMSHNVCYIKNNLRFQLGDIVVFVDNLFVVCGIDLSLKFESRFFIRDFEGNTMLVGEYELKPYLQIGDVVDAGIVSSSGKRPTCVVRKVEGNRAFVYCEHNKFGFWVSIFDVNKK